MKIVENSVQAKTVIEGFVAEGYGNEHIHLFAHSDKRAEDIADFLNVDAGSATETLDNTQGFFASIKNFFQPTPEDFATQLQQMGISAIEHQAAKEALGNGQLVIVAYHPPTV